MRESLEQFAEELGVLTCRLENEDPPFCRSFRRIPGSFPHNQWVKIKSAEDPGGTQPRTVLADQRQRVLSAEPAADVNITQSARFLPCSSWLQLMLRLAQAWRLR